MYPTAPAVSRVIAFSLLLMGASGAGRAPRLPSPGAAPACDTLAVPASGLVTLVAPGPNGVIAWTEGFGATEVRRAQGFTHGTTLLRAVPMLPRTVSVVARDDTSFIGSLMELASLDHPIEVGAVPLTVGVIVPNHGTTQTLLSITPGRSTSGSTLPAFAPVGTVRGNLDASLWCIATRGADDATQLACTTSGGKVVLQHQVHLAPHPLSTALWDSSVGAFAEQLHAPISEVRKQFTQSRSLTAAFDLLINGRSEIWLLRSPPAESTAAWERMAITGKSLTPVTLPSRLQLRALDGDIAYAADTDADGLQILVRCRLGLRDHGE